MAPIYGWQFKKVSISRPYKGWMFSRGVAMAWVRKSEGVPVKAWDFLQLLVQEEVDIPTPSSAGRLLRGGGDLLPQNYSSFVSNPKSSNLLCLLSGGFWHRLLLWQHSTPRFFPETFTRTAKNPKQNQKTPPPLNQRTENTGQLCVYMRERNRNGRCCFYAINLIFRQPTAIMPLTASPRNVTVCFITSQQHDSYIYDSWC